MSDQGSAPSGSPAGSAASAATNGAAEALLVQVSCRPGLDEAVRRQVEGVLGWQVVADGDAELLRAAVALVDGEVEGRVAPGVPTVLLVGGDATPERAARRAVATGARAAVAWPAERSRLDAIVGEILAEGRVRARVAGGADVLTLTGASGGVGTTTIALALGALAAWQGRPTLVVAQGDVPVPDVPVVAPEALAGAAAWGVAAPAPAVPALRVVAVPRGGPPDVDEVPSLPAGGLLVVDRGVGPGADGVLVARRDRAGAEAVERASAGAIVLLDEGPLSEERVLARAVAGTVAVLPRSARVARAGARRRVPAALPGSWLEPLRAFVPSR